MTTIEWTDKSWNPVRGCEVVSPGCKNCYAMRQAHRFSAPGQPYHGLTVLRSGKPTWTGDGRFVPEMLGVPLKRKKPTTWFVNSMSDLFHKDITNEQIAAVFGVMAACPQHTFQILTKRASRLPEWFEWMEGAARESPDEICHRYALANEYAEAVYDGTVTDHMDQFMWLDGKILHGLSNPSRKEMQWPLPNVHLGVSVEDQKHADERIPFLLQVPAAIRWISAEPLLGPIELAKVPGFNKSGSAGVDLLKNFWVVVGGESGAGARVCDMDWIRRIVSDCQRTRVPVFVKQLGAKPVIAETIRPRCKDGTPWPRHSKGGDMAEWPRDLRVREWPCA